MTAYSTTDATYALAEGMERGVVGDRDRGWCEIRDKRGSEGWDCNGRHGQGQGTACLSNVVSDFLGCW